MALQVGDLYVKFGSNAKTFKKDLDGVFKTTTGLSKGFGTLASAITPVNLGITGLAVGMAKLTSESIKLEKALDDANTILKLSDTELNNYRKTINKISTETGKSSIELTKALYETVSAGVEVGDALSFVNSATKLSIAGFTQTSNAVDLLTSLFNSYGDSLGSVEIVSAKLLEAQNKGKLTIDELTQSLANATSIGSNLGVTLDDILGATVTITKQGFSASVAVTQLRRLFAELSESGSVLSKTFKEITGVTFRDFIAEGGNLREAIKLIGDYANETGKELTDLTGRLEAGTALIALSGKNADEFAKQIDNIKNNTNDLNDITEEQLDNVKSQWDILVNSIKSNWDDLYTEVLKKPLTITLKFANELTGNNNISNAIKNIGTFTYETPIDYIANVGKAPFVAVKELNDLIKKIADTITNTNNAINNATEEEPFTRGAIYKTTGNFDYGITTTEEPKKYGYRNIDDAKEDFRSVYLSDLQNELDLTSEQLLQVTKRLSELGFDILAVDLEDVKTIIKDLDFKTPVEQALELEKERLEKEKEYKELEQKAIQEFYENSQKDYENYLEEQKQKEQNRISFLNQINEEIDALETASNKHRIENITAFVTNIENAMTKSGASLNEFIYVSELYQRAVDGDKEALNSLIKIQDKYISQANKKDVSITDEQIKDFSNALLDLGNVLENDVISSIGNAISQFQNLQASINGFNTTNAFTTLTSGLGVLSGSLSLFGTFKTIASALVSGGTGSLEDIRRKEEELQARREQSEEKFANAVDKFSEVFGGNFKSAIDVTNIALSNLDSPNITNQDIGYSKRIKHIKSKWVWDGLWLDWVPAVDLPTESVSTKKIKEYLENLGITQDLMNEAGLNVDNLVNAYKSTGNEGVTIINEEGLKNALSNYIKEIQDIANQSLKESLSITSNDITSAVIQGFENGDVRTALYEQFRSAITSAMLQSFGMTELYKALSDNMLKAVVEKTSTELPQINEYLKYDEKGNIIGVRDKFGQLSVKEQINTIQTLTDLIGKELNQSLTDLGIEISENTESITENTEALTTSNLPEGSKLQARIFDATAGVGTVYTTMNTGNVINFDFSNTNFGNLTKQDVINIAQEQIVSNLGTRAG